MRYKLQIKPNVHPIAVAIPIILTLVGLFWVVLPSVYVYADPARCDQPGWPSCYSVGTPMDTRVLEIVVLVVIVQNFVAGGMMFQGQALERRRVQTTVIPRAYNWAVIFIMLWINNIFVLDKVMDKIKLMTILRIISNLMIIH